MKTRQNRYKARQWKAVGAAAVSACLLLAACQTADLTMSEFRGAPQFAKSQTMSASVDPVLVNTETRHLALAGLKALESNDLESASHSFNLALKLDIRNSYLQFFNALTYHLRGLNGNTQDFDLARTGYEMAQQFDPTNWLAAYYEGLLFTDLRRYKKAQNSFARALLLERDNPDVLYQLAEASYYAQDLRSALSALKRLEMMDLDDDMRRRLAPVMAITLAGANQPEQAATYLGQYEADGAVTSRTKFLRRRIKSWSDFHVRHGQQTGIVTAQFALPEPEQEPASPPALDNQNAPAEIAPPNVFAPKPFPETPAIGTVGRDDATAQPADAEQKVDAEDRNQMVVVDVVILRTEDDNTTSTGINLLNGLQVQFGDALSGTPGLSFSDAISKDRSDTSDNESIRNITRLISIPAVTYSLNIANAADGRNEILARPTLVAMPGETSEFFSGVEVNAAAVSSGDGDSVSIDKEIGVKLAITPEILEDDYVRLEVNAERTFLTNPSTSIIFEFRLDTTKTSVNAAVTLAFGQTLILGGLSEREKEGNLDGVPLLRKVPIVKYLFSTETTRDYNKSVLILITPRRAITIDKSEREFEKRVSRFSERERDIERLSYAYRDWFRPNANVDDVFKHMNTNELYLEFKTGDFPLESWRSKEQHTARLEGALNYLFY